MASALFQRKMKKYRLGIKGSQQFQTYHQENRLLVRLFQVVDQIHRY